MKKLIQKTLIATLITSSLYGSHLDACDNNSFYKNGAVVKFHKFLNRSSFNCLKAFI